MRLALFATALALAGCMPRRAVSPVADAGAGDLAPILRPVREQNRLPALGGAIVTSRGIEHIGIVGLRRYDDPTPATLDDAFHMGSDTKAMTAVLIGYAVDHGKLAWDTTIAEVFPEWDNEMEPAYRAVTIDQLLAHRGGFPHESWPPGTTAQSLRELPGTPEEQRLAYVRRVLHDTPPQAAPGTRFVYSSIGYAILGAMLERRIGTPWEEIIARVLFGPLHMRGAGFGAMGHAGQVDALWQHLPRNGFPIPITPGPSADNPAVIAPAATVHVTMEGWGRFIVDQLRSFSGGGSILRPETYQHLHTPLFRGSYVGGWQLERRSWGGGEVFTHMGSNTQNVSVVWMAPRKDFAVLVASNVGGQAAMKACEAAVSALVQLELQPTVASEARAELDCSRGLACDGRAALGVL